MADLGWTRFNGRLAWLAWLFIHLIFLVEFENRLLVLVQWAWNYFTRDRSARLITGERPGRCGRAGSEPVNAGDPRSTPLGALRRRGRPWYTPRRGAGQAHSAAANGGR